MCLTSVGWHGLPTSSLIIPPVFPFGSVVDQPRCVGGPITSCETRDDEVWVRYALALSRGTRHHCRIGTCDPKPPWTAPTGYPSPPPLRSLRRMSTDNEIGVPLPATDDPTLDVIKRQLPVAFRSPHPDMRSVMSRARSLDGEDLGSVEVREHRQDLSRKRQSETPTLLSTEDLAHDFPLPRRRGCGRMGDVQNLTLAKAGSGVGLRGFKGLIHR